MGALTERLPARVTVDRDERMSTIGDRGQGFSAGRNSPARGGEDRGLAMIVAEPMAALRDPPPGTAMHARPHHGSHSHTPTRTRSHAGPAAADGHRAGSPRARRRAGDRSRRRQPHTATSAASQTAEPLVVEAQAIDTYLSDADTTAAGSFLQGQLQPASLRTRYMTDVAHASASLAARGPGGGSDPAVASAIRSVAVNLPIYTGLVQTATFNERQGYYPLADGLHRRGQQSHAGSRSSRRPRSCIPWRTGNLASDQDNAVSSPLLLDRRLLHRCCCWCSSSWSRSG